MLPVLAVGRNWMWVRYSPTNYINWFGEITWCNMFPMFSYMFSQWPNVFNHLMGNHWCFLERSLRHGNLRDDLSNKAHSTNEELEIYHHHGTKYLEISTNIAPKKNHIQPPHPISSNSTKRRPPHVICLRTSIHHYISRTINSTIIQHHPVLPKWCPEISRKYQRNIATPTPQTLSSANLAPFSSNQSCSDFSSTNFCLGVAMATKAVRQGSMAPKPLASKQPVFAWGSGRFPGISWWAHEISWGCNQCNHSKTGDFSPTTAKYASFSWKVDDGAMKT